MSQGTRGYRDCRGTVNDHPPMRWGGRKRVVVQLSDNAMVIFLDGWCRIELHVVERMLTTRGDDCAVMTEGRTERRGGDVRFAFVLGEYVHCAQVNLDCFQLD